MSKPIRANDNDKLPAVIASADPRRCRETLALRWLRTVLRVPPTSRSERLRIRRQASSDSASRPCSDSLATDSHSKEIYKERWKYIKRKVVAAAQRAAKRTEEETTDMLMIESYCRHVPGHRL